MAGDDWDRERLLRLCPENPGRPGVARRPVPRRLSAQVQTTAGELTVSATPAWTAARELWAVGRVCGLTTDSCCRLLDLIRAVELTPAARAA